MSDFAKAAVPGTVQALRNRFSALELSRPLFISEQGTINVATLIAASPIPNVAALAGKCVALALADPMVRCASLAWLDGVCRRILLVPKDVAASHQLQAFCRLADVEFIVSDDSGLPNAPSETPVVIARRAFVAQLSLPLSTPTEWVLVTSGTTGEPKLVAHRFATLARTVRSGDPRRSNNARWGLLYDVFRFAGLQVFLQSLIGCGTLILPSSDASLPQQVDFLALHGCDSLSATPTRWRQILMTSSSANLTLRRVTLGGEIADDRILAKLARRYPEAVIRHIYASTEAGVGFSVTDGRAGFPASFLDDPRADVELQVRSKRLFLRPRVRGQYYLSGQTLEDDDGFIDTGDDVERSGSRFLFLGRASGSINVAGNKVLPEEVEAVLLEHDFVEMARVYPVPSPITGALVAAEIKPVDRVDVTFQSEQLRRELIQYCQSKLPSFKVPHILKFVDDLEVSLAGKMVRRHA